MDEIVIESFSRVIGAGGYVFRFYVKQLQRLIPHPRLRASFFRTMGARIGKSVRIEDLEIINLGRKGFEKLEIGDYSLITNLTRLDLTDKIIIGQK